VVYSCKYHVVWCPKYRRKVLVNGVDIRLKALIERICTEYRLEVIEMEITPDHAHLLMEVDPQFGSDVAPGIWMATLQVPVSVDKFLFCLHSRRGPSVCYQAIYREPKNV